MLQPFTSTAIAVATSLVLAAQPAEAARTKLLHGGTIIAWDMAKEEPRVIREGSILIEDDQIKSIFDTANPQDEKKKKKSGIDMIPGDVEKVDCTHKIITPGFIDTHRHGWQTVFKTMGSNTTLVEYMGRYLGGQPAASTLTPDDLYISQLMGLYEALNAGVTTMLDHAHHTWTPDMSEAGLRACIDSGARVFWAYAFHGHDPDFTIAQQVEDWHTLRQRGDLDGSPSEVAIAYDEWSMDPHGEGTKQILDLIMSTQSSSFDSPLPPPILTSHTLSGIWGSVNEPSLLHHHHQHNLLDLPSSPFILSHASFISQEDMSILRETDSYVSITPESEMAYGHLNPTSHAIQDQASLGVDTHFTMSTDILTQARIWLQKTRYDLYYSGMLGGGAGGDGDKREKMMVLPGTNPMSVNQAFALATRKGGLALRRKGERGERGEMTMTMTGEKGKEKELGVIVEGAKADLVVWDGRKESMLGWVDPVAAVMLHANVGDIVAVIVDGEFRKKGGKMVVVKGKDGKDDDDDDDDYYEGLKDRFLEAARKVQDKMREAEAPPLKWWSDVPVGPMPGVDVVRGEGTGYGPLFWGGEEGAKEKQKEDSNGSGGGKDEL